MAKSNYTLIKVNNLTTINGLKNGIETKNTIFYQLIDNKDFKYLGNYKEYKTGYYDTGDSIPVPGSNPTFKIVDKVKLIFEFSNHKIEIFTISKQIRDLIVNEEFAKLDIYYEAINTQVPTQVPTTTQQQNNNVLYNGGRYKSKSSKKHKTSSTKKFRKL